MATDNRSAQRAPQRTRIFNATNRFDLDLTRKPAHMAYKWLRVSLAGQEDKENQIVADLNGWTPVPANRHPELAGRAATDKESIVRGGQMLVEQPTEYAAEARDLDNFAAREAVESQIARLGLQAKRSGAKGIVRTQEPVGSEVVE